MDAGLNDAGTNRFEMRPRLTKLQKEKLISYLVVDCVIMYRNDAGVNNYFVCICILNLFSYLLKFSRSTNFDIRISRMASKINFLDLIARFLNSPRKDFLSDARRAYFELFRNIETATALRAN